MEVRLFTSAGPESSLARVREACQELLKHKTEANIVCLAQALLAAERWLREAQDQFRDLARLSVMDTERMTLVEMETGLRKADLLYIPDGNAYLLNHRLHTARIVPHLRKKIQSGLPVVACGAGAVLCGPNILTALDLNAVPTTHFDGLGLTAFNLHVDYVDEIGRDLWLRDYHSFHENPVVLMEEAACVRISGRKTTLARGPAWILRPGHAREALAAGETIPLR